ncbi:MAG: B12-binding domain-containing radical SAM protein [Anaerohalosphaeraceae bacterium]|nr:B12-binding domain-containing radical SAM protein [Anaerohalosphaeraceae bacterium]
MSSDTKPKSDKLKILLLSVSSTSFFYEQVVIPFGLVSLGSFVDSDDYQMKGIEMNQPAEKIVVRYIKTDPDLLRQITDFAPDVIAISTYASNIFNCLYWTNVIKEQLPNTFIVFGGNHASYMAEEIMQKTPAVDAVIKFEGEIPFKMLTDKLKAKDSNYSEIPALTYRKDGRIIDNPKIELMEDLDALPLIDRDYFSESDKDSDNLTHIDMITARGCTALCTFCNCNHYWNKTHRNRSVDSVIKELKELKSRLPLKTVRFRDETVTLRKKHCLELCEAICREELNLEFQAHSRLDGLDEEVIAAMAKAGFEQLFIGVESGSKAVLKRLRKGINLEKLPIIIEALRKHGIKFRLSFMSSTPGEKFTETLQTVRLIKKLKLARDEYYIGVGIDIYPGTEECNRFMKLNSDYQWITKDYDFKGKYFAMKDPYGNIINPKFRQYSIYLSALMFFLLSPKYFLQKCYSILMKKLAKIFKF